MGNKQTTTINDIVDNAINYTMNSSNIASQLSEMKQSLNIGGPECGDKDIDLVINNSDGVDIGNQNAEINMKMLQTMLVSTEFANKLATDIKTSLDNKQTTDVIPISSNNSQSNINKIVKTSLDSTVNSLNEAIQSAINEQSQNLCANITVDGSRNISVGTQELKVVNQVTQDLKGTLESNNIAKVVDKTESIIDQSGGIVAMIQGLFSNVWVIAGILIILVIGFGIFMAMPSGGSRSRSIYGGGRKLPLDDIIYGYTSKPYNGPKPLNINKDTTLASVVNEHHINKNTKFGDLEPEPEPEIIVQEQEQEQKTEVIDTPTVHNLLDEIDKQLPESLVKDHKSGLPESVRYLMSDPTEFGSFPPYD